MRQRQPEPSVWDSYPADLPPASQRTNVWGDPINGYQPFVPEAEHDEETSKAIRAWRPRESYRDDGFNLVPMYGSKPFTPLTKCGDVHRGPIPIYSRCYCEVCGKTGEHIERRLAKPTPQEVRASTLKFKPKGAKPCVESSSPARGAASRSTSRTRTRGTKV